MTNKVLIVEDEAEIRDMGGKISARNTTQGVRFEITLPVAEI